MTFAFDTAPDDDAHDLMCDAVLCWGGYVVVNDTLCRVLTQRGAGASGGVTWWLETCAHAGRA